MPTRAAIEMHAFFIVEVNLSLPRKSLSVINPNASGDTKAKKRFMSESSVNSSAKNSCQVVDFRYLNSLNHWLASALQFEHPGFSIKTHFLPGGMMVLRFSLLDSLNLTEITDLDIDKLAENINLNSVSLSYVFFTNILFSIYYLNSI
ncbi:unnamed protein product [Hymenolepis diminuta]|uniref:SAM domain-containing protein n=1 Tax=Hymenolepis diminuta TaxID=6216 RepID=A0A0R3SGA4_HYMDI|nr:unnamed protein product [Hymenolepis diminuta]